MNGALRGGVEEMQRRQVQEAETAGEGLGGARGRRVRKRAGAVAMDEFMMGIASGDGRADAGAAWTAGQGQ